MLHIFEIQIFWLTTQQHSDHYVKIQEMQGLHLGVKLINDYDIAGRVRAETKERL